MVPPLVCALPSGTDSEAAMAAKVAMDSPQGGNTLLEKHDHKREVIGPKRPELTSSPRLRPSLSNQCACLTPPPETSKETAEEKARSQSGPNRERAYTLNGKNEGVRVLSKVCSVAIAKSEVRPSKSAALASRRRHSRRPRR